MNARTLVHRRVADRARRFPDLDPQPLNTERLSSLDAALARAIDHVVSRRWLTLAAVIESRLAGKRWDELHATVQSALLVGAAQLLLLEKIPDHAVIDQAVRWIKTTRRAAAAGLVNAVLRRMVELRGETVERPSRITAPSDLPRDGLLYSDGRMLNLAAPVFADDPLTRLAQQTSHDTLLIKRWIAAHGGERAIMLALHGLVQAPIIVTGGLDQPAGAHGGDPILQPHDEPGFAIVTRQHDSLHELLQQFPLLRIQDPTTARSIDLARRIDPPPSVVIDYCAGKGTKTRQLAAMFPTSRIVATEWDSARFSVLQQLPTQLANVEVVAFNDIRRFLGMADLLILDMPCSNTGVLARRVEAKYRFSRNSLASLITTQRQILADAIPLMREQSWMLYATCSIEPEENQLQAEWIAKTLRMSLIQEVATLPSGLPGEPPSGYRDGGYATLMQWQAT